MKELDRTNWKNRENKGLQEYIKRGKSMIGKNTSYDLLSDNCLHYADLDIKITANEGFVRLGELSRN